MFKNALSNYFDRSHFTINKTTVVAQVENGTDLPHHVAFDAMHDSSKRLDPPRCHPNTRDTVIEEIMTWIGDNNPAASMMVMHGPAGSGKSALAGSIAERCLHQQWLAAAFFFSRTTPGIPARLDNGLDLFPTIAYQLCSSHPEVLLPIRIRLWKDPTLLTKNIENVADALLVAPFFSWIYIALCWITGSFLFSWAFGWVHPRLIVIDGLDECDGDEIQSHILRAIATASERLRRPLRILVTCRLEIHISQTLSQLTNHTELDLSKHDASDDIQVFLNNQFEAIRRDHPLAKHGSFCPSWPGRDVIDQITKQASGQFIYPSLVMGYIASRHHSPQDRLHAVLRLTDEEPFAELHAFYKQIFPCDSERVDVTLMQQILIAIAQTEASAPGQYCTPAMIAQLLSPVHIEHVFLILEKLRPVISWAGRHEPMKFWHASISDYLLGEARSDSFFVDRKSVHEAIARGYLRLSRSQGPGFFLKSNPDFFLLFREHYSRACLSPKLQEDLVAFDLFSAYKAAVGEPLDLWKLLEAWESDRVEIFFRALVLHPEGQSVVDVYVEGLYKHYPLEPCIKESLQSFLDSKRSKRIETAIYHALYVPVLYGLLNAGDAASATSLGEKCTIGIMWAWSKPEAVRLPKIFFPHCHDCLSILLPHASHYSTELVNLLLEQHRQPSPSPKNFVNPAIGAYLEQFEGHVNAPPELKEFVKNYRESKPPIYETLQLKKFTTAYPQLKSPLRRSTS